jgi:hypothetical protein
MSCAELLPCDGHPPVRAAATYFAKEPNKDFGLDEAVSRMIFPDWLREL